MAGGCRRRGAHDRIAERGRGERAPGARRGRPNVESEGGSIIGAARREEEGASDVGRGMVKRPAGAKGFQSRLKCLSVAIVSRACD